MCGWESDKVFTSLCCLCCVLIVHQFVYLINVIVDGIFCCFDFDVGFHPVAPGPVICTVVSLVERRMPINPNNPSGTQRSRNQSGSCLTGLFAFVCICPANFKTNFKRTQHVLRLRIAFDFCNVVREAVLALIRGLHKKLGLGKLRFLYHFWYCIRFCFTVTLEN